MQVLKDSVKENILHSALSEFIEKGYEKASMRNIAANAGITAGNMYRYFKNKEDLFAEIISPAHKMMMDMVSYDALAKKDAFPEADITGEMAHMITELFTGHRAELFILLSKSSGSRFENYKQDLIKLVKTRIADDLFPRLDKRIIRQENHILALAMSSSLIEGLIVVLKECTDRTMIQKLSRQLIIFYYKDILSKYSLKGEE